MKINNINIEYNPSDLDCIQLFNDAFLEVSYKSKKIEKKLATCEITQKEFEKKQIKIIEKFFENITNEDTSKEILKECTSFHDYVKIFEDLVNQVNAINVFSNIINKKGTKNKKHIKKKMKCK